jgi:hypothetical protein
MSKINISNQDTPGYLALWGYTPQSNSYLKLTGTLNYLGVFPAAPVIPGQPGNGQPPWAYGPGNPSDPLFQGPFDYTLLPKLPTQPNFNLVQSFQSSEFTVTKPTGEQISLGNMLVSGSWQRPLSGLSVGDATFLYKVQQSPLGQSTPTGNLEAIQDIEAGDLFEWRLSWGTGSTNVGKGYILKSPEVFLNSEAQTQFTLELGCELALFSNTSRLEQSLYCGRAPKTSQEAARIYAQTHGLFTRTYSPGHDLIDLASQSFSNESPHQYLQALYAPTNQDVRCNNSSRAIICVPRPTFREGQAVYLSYKDTLELNPTVAPSFEPFNSIRVYNNYELITPNQRETNVYTRVSGQETNTKPWFQGGYTSTEVTEITQGDTLIWKRAITSGYIPTDHIISKADYELDPCSSEPLTTTFGVIKTETFAVSYQEHPSGAFLILGEQSWERGKKPRRLDDDSLPGYQPGTNSSGNPVAAGDWVIYDGILSYSKEVYEHTPQANPEVCSKDYIHLQTSRKLDTYGLENWTYIRLATEIDTYQSEGTSPTEGQSFYVGTGLSWQKQEARAEWDTNAQAYIVQPNRVIPNSNPPASQWVRPKLTEVNAFAIINNNLASQNGRLFNDRPTPENAPFCYTADQLQLYGQRVISENNGLAQSKELVVPYFSTLELGDPVVYTDQNQTTHAYQVYALSIAVDNNLVSKNLVLSRQDYSGFYDIPEDPAAIPLIP